MASAIKNTSRPKAAVILDKRLPGSLRLRGYQIAAVEHCADHFYRAMIADAPGLGKTPEAIATLLYAPKLLPAIVAVPKSVEGQWKAELKRWAPGIPLVTLRSGAATVPDDFKGIILTRHGLLASLGPSLKECGARTLILDEAHAFKDPNAKRTVAARDLSSKLPYVLLLTGTPILNRIEEFHALLDLVRPPGPKWASTDYTVLAERVIRRTSSDVGDALPPLSCIDLPVEPDPELMAEYLNLEETARRDLDHTGLDGRQVQSKLTALFQVTSQMKIPPVVEFLENQDKQALIFCKYRATAGAMHAALEEAGIEAEILTGETPKGERERLVTSFNTEATPRVLVCTEAMREGVNLQSAWFVVQLERYWVPAWEEQAAHRARRASTTHPVVYVLPRVEGTIDDRVAAALATKDATAGSVTSSLTKSFLTDQEAATQASEGVSASMVPPWANAGQKQVDQGQAEAPVALIFDLARWTGDDIVAWCAISGYTPRNVQKSGNTHLLIQLKPRDARLLRRGIRYGKKVLRNGVVGVIPLTS